jgi:ribosome biogenesis protein BMS1
MDRPDQKKHRPKVAGSKADKKKKKGVKDDDPLSAKQRNPKAFAIQSAVKAAKKFHRSVMVVF